MQWSRALATLFVASQTRAFSSPGNLRAMSAFDRVIVDETGDFDKVLETAIARAGDDKPLFLLFYAEWCPDCRTARPVIEESLSRLRPVAGALLVEANVARVEYKGNPAYPYRVHPLVQLTCVPTLIKMEKGAIKSRLGDTQAHIKELVDELVHGDHAGL